MALFGKRKGSEVVDFTGIYAKDRELRRKPNLSQTEKQEEVVDFSSFNSKTSQNNSDDFLSGLAGAGNSSSFSTEPKTLYPSPGPLTSSLRRARGEANMGDKVNEMNLKLEDNDYKINNLIEKIKELELRIREMERR